MLASSTCGEENQDRARFCSAFGVEIAEPGSERRKLVTLLFCDMSGSTALGERVDAESGRDLMFRYFHATRGANDELYGGWPMILSGLKTLLETGEKLTTPGSRMYSEASPAA
jgi:hypothetical protein